MRDLALRDRLAVSFALALICAYAAIAVAATIVVNGLLSGSVDGRLSTVARAIVTIAGDPSDEIDREDRQQFASITADASGALVLDADRSIILGTVSEIPDWIPAAVNGARIGSIFSVRAGGHEMRTLVERKRKHGTTSTIVVWQSMQIVRDVEETLILVLGGCGIAVTIGGYFAGAQIARRGLLPLTRITAIVADIAANDLDARLGPQPHADELGLLATTFDRMLDRLQSAFERQRRFTANASHDLRAPLATLRAEVDLALRRERTTAEYRAALIAIAGDADQLDRLIDALLAAARSDADDLVLLPVRLGAVAGAAVDAISAFAGANGVAIFRELAGGDEISGDAGMLERAILAILHNAVKYTPAGGTIRVSVANAGDRVALRVRDGGTGFTDVALTHALDRFWRDDAARARSSGSGLGLAIAAEIVRRCGGMLTIENSALGGGEVAMQFAARVTSRDPGEPQRA